MACDGVLPQVQSLLSSLELVLGAWDRQISASRKGLEAVKAVKALRATGDGGSGECDTAQAAETAEAALLEALAASKAIESQAAALFQGVDATKWACKVTSASNPQRPGACCESSQPRQSVSASSPNYLVDSVDSAQTEISHGTSSQASATSDGGDAHPQLCT